LDIFKAFQEENWFYLFVRDLRISKDTIKINITSDIFNVLEEVESKD